MKKQRKHILSLVLMGSSLLFLLTFQYFWLKQVYEDEKRNFFKETNLLFFDVMSALQDSLIQKNIKSASVNDSVNNFKYFAINDLTNESPPAMLFEQDSSNAPKGKQALRVQTQTFTESKVSISLSSDSKSHSKKNIKLVLPKNKSLDSTKYKISSNAEIQVFIASNKPQDSINQILESVIKNRSQLPQQTKSFVIRLDGDTISDAGVRQYFQQAIDKANIPLNFELKKTYDRIHARQGFLFGREIAQPETGMLTAPFFCIPPSPIYQIYFPEYQSLIFFRKMFYPFIFSFALFVLTAGAFFLIYNNLQKQEKLILLKNDFISNVTHELKTPVTTVGVAIEALQNFNALQNPSLTKEYLEISQNELNRLSMLIDKIMKMSSFESKGIELKLTNIDIQQLINQILKSMKLQFDKYEAKVEFFGAYRNELSHIENVGQGNNPMPVHLLADEVHLTNVIYNLLDNALKYSKEHPQIVIRLQDFTDKIVLSFQDNGIGISSEYKDKVFDKFFRVPTGNIHNIKGYGLGLSYVASVIHQHGGAITVESKEGIGSIFTISLPKKA